MHDRLWRPESGSEPAADASDSRDPIHRLRMGAAIRRQIQRKAEAREKENVAIPEGAGNPLPNGVREQMESKIGADFSKVRVHTNGESQEAAKDLGAKAFTVDHDIHFSAGRFDPGSRNGQHLLAHELAHVAQGQGGLHKKGEDGVSQPSDPEEQHADAVADEVVAGKKVKGEEGEAAESDGEDTEADGGKAGAPKKKDEPFPIGTELYVKRSLLGLMEYHHASVYVGKGQVVHVNSDAKKATKNLFHGKELAQVEHATLSEFQNGEEVSVGPSKPNFTPKERAQRAISHLGEQWHYRPLDYNCQHFSSEMVSGNPHSPEGQEIAHALGMHTDEDKQHKHADKEREKNDAQFKKELKGDV